MVDINIKIDPAKLSEIDRKCGIFIEQQKINDAINRAAKRAAETAKTAISKEIPKKYTIPSNKVKEAIKIRAVYDRRIVGASLDGLNKPIGLTKFKGTKPSAPTGKRELQKLEIKKGHKFTVKTRFPAEMKSGHIGIFSRTSGRMQKPYQRAEKPKWGRNQEKVGRAAINERFGPSITGMFRGKDGDNGIAENIKQRAVEVFNKRLDHEIERLLK